jgi:hypothetical protein
MYSWVGNLSAHTRPGRRSPELFVLHAGEDVYFTGNKSKKVYRLRLNGRKYKDVYYEIQNWEGKKAWVFASGLKSARPAPAMKYINMPILNKGFIHKLLPQYETAALTTNDALYVPLEDFDICFPNIKVSRNQFYQYKDSYYYVLNFTSGLDGEPVRHPFFVFQKKEISSLVLEYKVSATIYFDYADSAGVWKSRDIPAYDTSWSPVLEKGSLMFVFSETLGHYNLLTHVPPEAFRKAEEEKMRVWDKNHKAGGNEYQGSEGYKSFMSYYSDIMNLQVRVSWKDEEGILKSKSINFYYQHGK